MDDLDLAILRAHFPDGIIRLGGADPRISAATIGSQLGVGRSTVIARLRRWKASGFSTGWIVFPTPRLFGLRLYGQILRVASAAARERVSETVRTLPNVADVYEPAIDGFYWLAYVGRSPDVARRGARTMGALEGVRVEVIHHPFPMPECGTDLTPLDWKILQAVRRAPNAPLGTLARSLRLGVRTVSRRFARLIASRALLYKPRLDFSRSPGTIVERELLLEPGAAPEDVWAEVRRASPVFLPHYYWGSTTGRWDLLPGEREQGGNLSYYVCASSPAAALRAQRVAETWPGVRRVEQSMIYRWWESSAVYDGLIDARVDAARARSA